MFNRWFSPPRFPIGIDVGARHVRLMQLQRQGETLSVLAAARQELHPQTSGYGEVYYEHVAEVISHLIDTHPFIGNTVVSCLPSPVLHCKNLRLPKMPADELPQAVQWEASDRLPLGEEAITQFIDAGIVRQGEEQRQEIILLAATQTAIDQHTRALVQARLQPIAIDAIPTALARCIGRGDHEQVHAVVDIGYAHSKVLLCRGPDVLFYKQIDVGGAAFDQAVVDKLGVSVAEASELRQSVQHRDAAAQQSVAEAVRPHMVDLSREVGLCLRYYSVTFRGQRPERALLLGGEAHMAGLAEAIAEGAAIETSFDDPLAGIDLGSVGRLEQPGEWAVAAGLALRPMDGTPARTAGKRGAA